MIEIKNGFGFGVASFRVSLHEMGIERWRRDGCGLRWSYGDVIWWACRGDERSIVGGLVFCGRISEGRVRNEKKRRLVGG